MSESDQEQNIRSNIYVDSISIVYYKKHLDNILYQQHMFTISIRKAAISHYIIQAIQLGPP